VTVSESSRSWAKLSVTFVATGSATLVLIFPPATGLASRRAEAGNESPGSHDRRRTDVAASSVRVRTVFYLAHDGQRRLAFVELPAWYGPRRAPVLPLVISPHGRGITAGANLRLWGDLPALGRFALVSPEGQGRRLMLDSWGYSGQIDDLARMPAIVKKALPWIRIDRRRIYAFGGSMGGQETLLLLARHPRLLAGAAAFDSVTDLALQYRNIRFLHCGGACRRMWGTTPLGIGLRRLVAREVGGTPTSAPRAYADRSPLRYARAIAFSRVPLQLWWSVSDAIVRDQGAQSGRLFWRIEHLDPAAPLDGFVGDWIHSHEMRAYSRLPLALAIFGLLPPRYRQAPFGLHSHLAFGQSSLRIEKRAFPRRRRIRKGASLAS